MRSDEAIVLVGGLGTRLRDVVSDLPKPLAPVAGRPFLAWLLDQMAASGFRHVILAAGYMADKIEHVAGREWRGMDIDYSIESQPLGTGGAVRDAGRLLRGAGAHQLNVDTFHPYPPEHQEALLERHGGTIAMALANVPDVSRYGAVTCDGARVLGFQEKGVAGPGQINAGCYYLSAEAIGALPTEAAYSFETAVLAPVTLAGQVRGCADTEGFIDIGVPEDYRRAQGLFGAPA
jgi:D-glycero-alpha-D-manno-heptose 1-phosphate guanylyltransferase